MNTINRRNGLPQSLIANLARAFIVAGFLFCATRGLEQSAPVLTITPLGTNQFSISFTNNGGTYDLQSTPVLANPEYPWTWAAIGTNAQTNFLVTGVYQTGFYRAILDTNSVPLWEVADPNNPSAGILNVWIDSPANGTTLN